ncbi:reverse transcriptase domain-containing protein [Tanacetum coccineum]
MTGVPRSIAEHRLNVRKGCQPIRQKRRGQALDRNKAIQEEVAKLVEAEIIREVHYHDWLSNPVIVKKHDGSWRMDIEETFHNLRRINMKLNLKKCTFGAEEGAFLGHVVSMQGIKACPEKTKAVMKLQSPQTLKEAQSLNEKLASLNRFLSKSAEKSLPFFKTLKSQGSSKRSPTSGKGLAAAFDITYRPRTSIRGQILADLIAEIPDEEGPLMEVQAEEAIPEPWTLFTDGSSCLERSGAGLILMNPEGEGFTYTLRFKFDASNNEAEYEALVAGLRIAEQMGVKNLIAKVDSCLVANQINGSYEAEEQSMT